MGFIRIQRTEHDVTRAANYEYLLALAKHHDEIPLQEASGMLVQCLWAM